MNWVGGTHLVFLVLRFLATFVVVPSLIPASSSSSGALLAFLIFLVVGFVTCSSAFEGPRFRVFETAGGAVAAFASLARRLGAIVRWDESWVVVRSGWRWEACGKCVGSD